MRAVGSPVGEGGDVVFADKAAIFAAKQIFEQDAKREGKLRGIADAFGVKNFEAMNFESLRANIEFVSSAERIGCGDGHTGGPFQMTRAFYNNRKRGLRRRRYNEAL